MALETEEKDLSFDLQVEHYMQDSMAENGCTLVDGYEYVDVKEQVVALLMD